MPSLNEHQVINVATQIYCRKLATLDLHQSPTLIESAISEARQLIEMVEQENNTCLKKAEQLVEAHRERIPVLLLNSFDEWFEMPTQSLADHLKEHDISEFPPDTKTALNDYIFENANLVEAVCRLYWHIKSS